MVRNFLKKILWIRFRVFLKKDVDAFARVFERAAEAMKKSVDGHDSNVAKFYEIESGGQFYSGADYEQFRQLYESNYSPQLIRWQASIPAVGPSTHPVESALTVQLSSDGSNRSFVEVLGENDVWVKGTISDFEDSLNETVKCNRAIRSAWMDLLVRLGLVLLVSGISIGAAEAVAKRGAGEFLPLYTFVVVFLCVQVLGNHVFLWIAASRDRYFPELEMRPEVRKSFVLAAVGVLFTAAGSWGIKQILDLVFFGGVK
jgi:hypothetical protein